MKNLLATFAIAITAFSTQGCSRNGLASNEQDSGGQAGTSQGGGPGAGGVLGAGGATGSGGSLASGGSMTTGGTAGSGANGSGGKPASGGVTGTSAGGSPGSGGTGGRSATGGITGSGGMTACPPVVCPAIRCANGSYLPDPCGCPVCLPLDAGVSKDASPDACVALPCAMPVCGPGTQIVTPPCGCPTCVPVDAGADSGGSSCSALDECACMASKTCAPIAEACYCPSCEPGVVCACGGGRYVGCAPVDTATCTSARARVASLCPQLTSATFKNLCTQKGSECTTKCLNEVTACGDITCSMCEGCDCAGDKFSRCMATCQTALGS